MRSSPGAHLVAAFAIPRRDSLLTGDHGCGGSRAKRKGDQEGRHDIGREDPHLCPDRNSPRRQARGADPRPRPSSTRLWTRSREEPTADHRGAAIRPTRDGTAFESSGGRGSFAVDIWAEDGGEPTISDKTEGLEPIERSSAKEHMRQSAGWYRRGRARADDGTGGGDGQRRGLGLQR